MTVVEQNNSRCGMFCQNEGFGADLSMNANTPDQNAAGLLELAHSRFGDLTDAEVEIESPPAPEPCSQSGTKTPVELRRAGRTADSTQKRMGIFSRAKACPAASRTMGWETPAGTSPPGVAGMAWAAQTRL